MKKLIAIACLALIGCSAVVPITTEHLKRGCAVSCGYDTDCPGLAFGCCPSGYSVLSKSAEQRTMVVECLDNPTTTH